MIEAVRELVTLTDELVELASWWAGWARPITEEQLAAFEAEHEITLWPAHRALLTEIGDHAPLPMRPGGALAPLAAARALTTVRAFMGPLAEPFPHVGAEAIELEWDEASDEYADPLWLRGCLPLAGAGCDESHVLVVSGPDRGRVWGVTPSGSQQLHPTTLEFSCWYRAELERGLERERARARAKESLERRCADDPTDIEALIELGSTHLFDDRARATRLIEQAWALGREDPGAHGLDRAIAQLELLEGRHEHSDAMLRTEAPERSPFVRSFAAIAAARRDDNPRALELFEGARTPAVLRQLAAGYHGLALWRSGQPARAIEVLSHASGLTNVAITARIQTELGALDDAKRNLERVRLGLTRGGELAPSAPTLADAIALPAPSLVEVEAALAGLVSDQPG